MAEQEIVIDTPDPVRSSPPPVEDEKEKVVADADEEELESQDESTEEPESEDETPAPKKRSRPGKAQRRINRLEQELRELRERQAAAPVKPAEAKTDIGTPPDPKDFGEDTEAFIDARAKYQARLVLQEDRAAARDAEKKQAEADKLAEFQATKSALLADGAEEFEDFEDLVTDPALRITQEMLEALGSSDSGHKVLYHLAQHHTEAERIAKLGPLAQAREIGKLEAKVLQKPAKRTSAAPDPIKPVGGSGGGITKDPSEMTQAEYEAWRAKGGGR